ncbi:MAG: hypothetical protein ABI877_12350 [Gemmatimonadaceae bacterium]
MTDSVRVYVNARPVDAPADGTALDAVRAFDPAMAEQVTKGARAITDSRGIPIDASTVLATGAIFRVVHARTVATEYSDEE